MANTAKEDLAKVLGERLKELRKATKDVGQKDVADELGITKQALSSYESGRHIPDLPILVDLADYYSCSIEYLLGLDEKINRTIANSSEPTVLDDLTHALDTVANDEGEFLVDGVTKIVNALSISKGNPERIKFIDDIGNLFLLLAEYIEVSTINGKYLLERSKKNTVTAEDVSVALAKMYGYDDIYTLIEGIKRTGAKAVIAFSVNAKKALRIRTGWRNTIKKSTTSKHTD